MKFIQTPLKDAYIVEMEPFCDERGMFARAFCCREFEERGMKPDVVQCNISHSVWKGILRGLHYQAAPFAETKMVRCIRGGIYDVIVDIRPVSPTYLGWFGVELTSANRRMLYVPEGFAHGYETLADDSEIFYMVSQFYAPEFERGIRWNDRLFGIEWPYGDPMISPKDAGYPDFEDVMTKGGKPLLRRQGPAINAPLEDR
ncbi:MAG: dTDP-4-dehydrorhamnose 3,5-epimerase [Syntrophorhabdales bacterium]|jgi:dTDP-4-dehydrorhamnose 3,5-epimerase